jgi:hypothetical protein
MGRVKREVSCGRQYQGDFEREKRCETQKSPRDETAVGVGGAVRWGGEEEEFDTHT